MARDSLAPRPDPAGEKETLTAEEVAALVGCSVAHVVRMAARGAMPGRLPGLGTLRRFSKAEVMDWLRGQSRGPMVETASLR